MDLNVVQGFFVIVEAGSMGKAAVRLRVSQSTLTRQVQALEARIREMQEMKATLEHLVHSCAGDDRPDCPILTGLAATGDACCD